MKKLLLLLFILPSLCFAGTLAYDTTYATNGGVTGPNLNGNFTNVKTVVNGGLDNTNANTTSGFRFYETLSALPTTSLSQGRAVFLTTDNTFNLYTGTAWVKYGGTLYYDYVTSLTTGTSKSPGAMMFAYGQAANVTTNGNAVITGLPFTGFTTYRCQVTPSTSSTTNISAPTYVGNTGAQITVYNTDDTSTLSLMWLCMGT